MGNHDDLLFQMKPMVIAVVDLDSLGKEFAAPAHMCFQLLGTLVDSTKGLLTAPMNAIDGGDRKFAFNLNIAWDSLMQAVHRYFLSSLQVAIEKGLRTICKEHEIEVSSSLRRRAQEVVDGIADKITPEEAKAIMDLVGKHPQFDDYLNATIKAAALSQDDAKMWRRFFRALSIIRNKVSHSDASLSEAEITSIKAGGLDAAVKDVGLGWGSHMYAPVVSVVAEFFRSVLSKLPPVSPA